MQKEAEKTTLVMRRKSGVVEALIYSIIPLLILTYLLSCFWNLAEDARIYGSVSGLISDVLAYNCIALFGILGLLGLNLLAYYVMFRVVGKTVACPWCCVAICLQVMAVGYYVVLFF